MDGSYRAVPNAFLDAVALVNAIQRRDTRAINQLMCDANHARDIACVLAQTLPRAIRAQGTSVEEFLRGIAADEATGDKEVAD